MESGEYAGGAASAESAEGSVDIYQIYSWLIHLVFFEHHWF